ncbi:hypothetical protein LINPERPRIM_LOCUS24266, partial [Linum perenne]
MLIGSFKEVQLRPITVSLPLHIEEDIDLYTSSKKRLIVLKSLFHEPKVQSRTR